MIKLNLYQHSLTWFSLMLWKTIYFFSVQVVENNRCIVQVNLSNEKEIFGIELFQLVRIKGINVKT